MNSEYRHNQQKCNAQRFRMEENFELVLEKWGVAQTGNRVYLQCGRPSFNPWVRRIPWRRAWQPTPVFLPAASHGQRSLAVLWDGKELDTTEWLSISQHKKGKRHVRKREWTEQRVVRWRILEAGAWGWRKMQEEKSLENKHEFHCWCFTTLSIHPTISFPHCAHKSVLYVCVSLVALQKGSSVPSF